MRKINKDNKNLKSANKIVAASLVGAMLLSGCGKKIEETPTTTTTTPTTTVATEATTPINLSDLDITNNDSIEYVAEQSYQEYKAYYDAHGLTKDDIINMILVLNSKYTNSDNQLIISAAQASTSYANLDNILESDEIIQAIDNINMLRAGDITKEQLPEFDLVNAHPDLTKLIDRRLDGAEYVLESVTEYQTLRNNVIYNINNYIIYNFDQYADLRDASIDPATVIPYNIEEINNYLFDQEIYEYNNDRDNLDNITQNGFRWILDTTDKKACDIAGQVNVNVIKITSPEGIDLQINYTNEQADVINNVITYQYSGLPVPEELAAQYVEIQTIVPVAKHFADICNVEAQTTATINEIASLTNANSLTLTQN